jgi:8-amino-3,8-dideoxy-alpha-D-manno-octulosonate transaminase
LNEAQQKALEKLNTTSFEKSDAIMSKCISTAISLTWTEAQVHEKGALFLSVLLKALA